MKKDYYKILGITQDASQDMIKRAYYTLSKKYHPDILHKETSRYKDIREAYETLKDPLKRKRYDEGLTEDEEIFTESTSTQNDYEESKQSAFSQVNSRYYENPTKEPIVNILDSFWDYKFENAMTVIWKRNIFVLIGSTIITSILTSLTFFNRIAKLFKKTILPSKRPTGKWTLYLYEGIEENTLLRFFIWSIFLIGMTTGKIIYYIGLLIYWIGHLFFKYILLPLAIVFSALILTGSRNR